MNVQIIVSKDEYDKIKRDADARSLAMSSYLRTKIFCDDKDIDAFYAKLLESFKLNFNDDIDYNGKVIKAFTNGLIQRII